MPEPKKLFLLDAMALIYRAYFALNKNPRINSKGLNTSAILGFANTLFEVIKKEKPTHIGVAFDTIVPTVRHEEFTEYKATRERMPEDISISIPIIKQLIEIMNIPILFVDGYEADDVIGTLSKKAEREGFQVYMMTPDKDFGQLVSENIFMYKPARMGKLPEKIGVEEICKKYKISRPEQLIDILGLWGDVSDNIPGVPGIGEKRASILINEFGSIENLLQNTESLKGKQKENIEKFADQALMSKKLATIILDVPIDFDKKQLEKNNPDFNALKQLFEKLEFRALAKRVFSDFSLENNKDNSKPAEFQTDLFAGSSEFEETQENNFKTILNTDHKYFLLNDKEKRNKLFKTLSRQKSFCFDTETTGTDTSNSELVGLSFSYKTDEAFYIPLPENYNDCYEIVNEFKEILENPEIEKIGQNLKFDISMLRWYDIDVKGKFFDTMIAHYLIQPDMRHNMDVLAETYLNYSPVSTETLIGKKGKNQRSMRSVDIEIIKDYACEDADITLQLKNVFEPILSETKNTKLFSEIETPLIKVLSSMEAEGVKLDSKALNAFSEELREQILETQNEIFKLSNSEFNISSPKQLGEILFEKLKIIERPKLTKTKQYSTGEEVLRKLVNKHPIVRSILDFRSLTKLKSTYVDALPNLVSKRDGRIHTSYNQAVTSTGRLSSNNPNLQNIPIRTEKGREIRKAFVPRNENYVLLAADYSQIELRIIAELSNDKGMLEAFKSGIDIHTSTAAKVYGVTIDEVTSDMRRNAKSVNFGIIYGISAFGLSEQLNIPRKEAAEIIKQYFVKYPDLQKYMEKTKEFARKNGYVETIMGRRRYLRDINSNNAVVRGFAERNAVNAPIQGSSADMIKIAMINIFNEFEKQNLKSKMILQVHDELVFDTYKSELELVKPIIADKMKNAIKLNVPIEIDINVGENWLEAH
ncbi:MAG: DNA polymerase I [Bacteroidales bacterium]|nr:DNA polymerase I [Bacteroidales bacterium]